MALATPDRINTQALPAGVIGLRVTGVTHYTDHLFSFTLERPAGLKFRSGEFIMLGLMIDGKPVLRAYSIASPTWDEALEFYSIKVAEGALTSRLQHLQVNDTVIVRQKAVGTLVHDALTPAKRLFLLSTGTGVAPFASTIRDPETYDKFENVILVQTTRTVAELQYGQQLVASINHHPLLGEMVGGKLQLITSTTREDHSETGRIDALIASGRLQALTGGEPLNPLTDRVMICGSMAMLKTLKAMCMTLGFREGSNSAPGEFVIERSFVD